MALATMQVQGSNAFVAWHILHQYSPARTAEEVRNRWQQQPANSRAGAIHQGQRAASAALWLSTGPEEDRLPASMVPLGGGSPAGYRYHAVVTMTDLALGTDTERTISIDSPTSLSMAEVRGEFAALVASTYSGFHQSGDRTPTVGAYLFKDLELYAVERANA